MSSRVCLQVHRLSRKHVCLYPVIVQHVRLLKHARTRLFQYLKTALVIVTRFITEAQKDLWQN